MSFDVKAELIFGLNMHSARLSSIFSLYFSNFFSSSILCSWYSFEWTELFSPPGVFSIFDWLYEHWFNECYPLFWRNAWASREQCKPWIFIFGSNTYSRRDKRTRIVDFHSITHPCLPNEFLTKMTVSILMLSVTLNYLLGPITRLPSAFDKAWLILKSCIFLSAYLFV